MATSNTSRIVQAGGWKPALALVIIAPMVGELLTSSAPPLVFFVPWVFLVFALLYGCGALLIRELMTRAGKGWPSILLLGAAYGILEEGIGAKSFFDPKWRAIGPLGVHGRAYGVNWIWTLDLILLHAAFCIGLSILTVQLIFPKQESQPWLGRGPLLAVAILYGLDLLLLYQKGGSYAAPAAGYAACFVAVTGLVAAAFLWRGPLSAGLRKSAPTLQGPAWRFGALGFSAAAVYILQMYYLPSLGLSPWLSAALVVGLALFCANRLVAWTRSGASFSADERFWLVAGAFGFFALLAPLQEINPSRPDSGRGMALVGIGTAGFLYWLRRRVAPRRDEPRFLAQLQEGRE